ncbi:MAG: ABC transporter permease [Bifidobacteriaceae bacterium]|jgi:spermidine/putrescine transport system permease protein|nr:ABC transporter permease [Bifidobacteriaceae bacterium]
MNGRQATTAPVAMRTQAKQTASGTPGRVDGTPAAGSNQAPPRRPEQPVRGRRRKREARRLRLTHFPGLGLVSAVSLAFLYIPMVIVVVYSFNAGRQALYWQGFSFDWYARVFHDASIINATRVSLQVAVIATAVSTVMAVMYVLAADRLARWGSALAMAMLAAPIVVPEVIMGVATLAFIRLIGLSPGFWPLVAAHTCFCFPFALMNIRARYANIDSALFESAADLGASEAALIWRVTLPLLAPGIVSGALLAFVVSMDDFMISNFLASAGSTTLPVYIFGLIRKGVSPSVNVVAALLLVLAVAVTTTTTFLSRQRTGAARNRPRP